MKSVLAPAGAQNHAQLPVRQRPAQPLASSMQLARQPINNWRKCPVASVCTCSASQRRSSSIGASSSSGTSTSASSSSSSTSSDSKSSSYSKSSHTGAWLSPRGAGYQQQLQQQRRRRAWITPKAALAGTLGGTSPLPDDASTPAAAAAAANPAQQRADTAASSLPPSTTNPNPSSSSSGVPAAAGRRFQLWSLGAPLAWGFMLGYIGLMLVLPITAMLTKASSIPLDVFMARATEPVALSAYFVSFSVALAAAAINAVFGFVLAWVLVKYKFPGKKWVDAAVDLPFALPTSVAGLTLATVYSDEGVLGAALMAAGIDVVFTRLGVAVAMVFVSFPFVVRTMQPVLQEMEKEVEEAAYSLGADPWTTFTKVLLPPLLPPLLTGTALAFSRALGEFGSVVIVSSNFPFKDLIAPVLIFQCLEQYDFVGATVIGTVLLMISLVMMVGVNWLQSYAQRFRK